MVVSVLFSEPKIPQSSASYSPLCRRAVSVLFSEPKSPQCGPASVVSSGPARFSALQRAENSSIDVATGDKTRRAVKFQCSSASRKFLNRRADAVRSVGSRRFSALQRAENSSITRPHAYCGARRKCFSALQRAENSSIWCCCRRRCRMTLFQCSSASRKFLNDPARLPDAGAAQFQCSSASRKFLNHSAQIRSISRNWVSVLFSEPKIPQ